ncbi:MAG: ABC transporter permease subunit [Firmicutes bacterium]|nr:ABC transporter permease subunit [Bacillota bacterium]
MKTCIIRGTQNKSIRRFLAAALWILIWQCLYWFVGEDLLLSSPWIVVTRLWQLAGTAEFWGTVGRSCLGIVAGFMGGVILGTVLGVLTSGHGAFYEFVRVPMNLIKAIPVASFIILTLLWIPSRRLSVFISLLMVLPMVWANVDQGVSSTDRNLLEVAKVYGFSRWKTLRHVYLPAVLPFLKSASKVALGFAWKSGIAAEVIVTPLGFIGKKLYDAKVTLETADMFAWTAVVILLSVCFEKLFGWLLDQLGSGEVRK